MSRLMFSESRARRVRVSDLESASTDPGGVGTLQEFPIDRIEVGGTTPVVGVGEGHDDRFGAGSPQIRSTEGAVITVGRHPRR